MRPHTYRSIFISDTHLGMKAGRVRELLDFLRHHECQTLYLVGDIIDGKSLSKTWYWTELHDAVIDEILGKVQRGTEVVYVPGNHDIFLRAYTGHTVAGIHVVRDAIHETVDGKKLWILHGDEYDGIIQVAPWLALLGKSLYHMTTAINHQLNRLRRALHLPYRSLAVYLKSKSSRAMRFVHAFEGAICEEARKRKVDGVLCGHIHKPHHEMHDGLEYYNTGDWVDNCSAIAEHVDGSMVEIRWPEVIDRDQPRSKTSSREARRERVNVPSTCAI